MKSEQITILRLLLGIFLILSQGCTRPDSQKRETNAQGYTGIANFVVTRFTDENEEGRKVRIQPDGKIVAAGWIEKEGDAAIAIARYLPSGKLDPEFADGGKALVHLNGISFQVSDILFQPSDGKILVSGAAFSGTAFNASLVRLLPDGERDAGFGIDGVVMANFGTANSHFAGGISLQSGGKIIAAGAANRGSGPDFLAARFLDNGSLDASFGEGGSRLANLGPGADIAYAVGVDSQDRVILSGASDSTQGVASAVVRLTPSGERDNSFGTEGFIRGKFQLNGDDHISAMALQPDDKILLAGSVNAAGLDSILARFTVNGEPDLSFGNQGRLKPSLGNQSLLTSLRLSADNGILAGGAIKSDSGDSEFLVLKLLPDGSTDTRFGERGLSITHVSDSEDRVNGIDLQSDGKVLAIGATLDASGDYDFALARYLPNGLPDFSFSNEN